MISEISDNLTRSDQDRLYAELEKLCPDRLGKKLDRIPDDCLPIVEEIAGHLYRLVMSVAKKCSVRRGNLSFDDLVQEGCIGLLRGIWRFNPGKKVKASTYVTYWIKQSINRAIDTQSKTIRIPVEAIAVNNKISIISNRHKKLNGFTPNIHEIADYLELKPEKVKRIIEHNHVSNTTSLDIEVEDSLQSLYNFIPNKDTIDCERLVEISELEKNLDEIFREILSAREERLIRMRFGLSPYEKAMILDQIGEKFGFTRERARQIEKEALSKLRENASLLREFL